MSRVIARRHDAVRQAISPLPGSEPYDSFRPLTIPADSEGETLCEVVCRVVPHVSEVEWKAVFAEGLWVDAKRIQTPALKNR